MKTWYYPKTMNNNLIIYTILLLLVIVVYFPLKSITGQVCTETITTVLECPNNTIEYEKRASEKCSKACGNSEGDMKYKYHCMLDSFHKDLVEMCAIPKYLFDYCPAYHRKGKQIQKDESRPCNTSSSKTYYNSDELFFCDLTNCLGSFTSTTSDSPSETTDMTMAQIPYGESWYLHLKWIAATVVTFLIIGLIIFLIRKRQQSNESSNCLQISTPDCLKPQRMKRKETGGPNGSLLVWYNTRT